jgi:PAS domain S-box-containing protein
MVDSQSLLTQNMQLARELKQRIDQLAAVGTVAASVSQSLDLDLTLKTALRAVLDTVGAEAGGISLIDEKTNEVVLRAQQGWIQDFVTTPMRIPLGAGMSGRVIASDDVIVNNNLTEDEQLAVPSFHEEHFRSIVMAPMHARSKIVGILSIMSSKPYHFDRQVIDMLRAIADTVGVALDNARLYEASVENENRISAILHSTADGIIALSQNGRIRLINHAAERLLGVKAHHLLDVPLRNAPMPPNVRNVLLAALSARSDEGSNIFQIPLGDGRILSALVSAVSAESSQLEQDRETDGWVIVLQDVTHLRQAEEARVQFIQAAAHDMRNPLGITINSLELINSMIEKDETVQEIIDIAMQGVTRVQGLIDDLLNLEHIESGYGFNIAPVSIGDVLDEVIAEIRPCLMDKDISYRVEVTPGIPLLQIDRRWVVRAVLNYLDNAYKYIHHGGHIVLRVFDHESLLHIEVADNGPGMPPEAQARLFERFYRANDHASVPGSGLGLAIVKSVAEAHGGDVYVRSKPGEGSTFGLTLRLVYEEARSEIS